MGRRSQMPIPTTKADAIAELREIRREAAARMTDLDFRIEILTIERDSYMRMVHGIDESLGAVSADDDDVDDIDDE